MTQNLYLSFLALTEERTAVLQIQLIRHYCIYQVQVTPRYGGRTCFLELKFSSWGGSEGGGEQRDMHRTALIHDNI